MSEPRTHQVTMRTAYRDYPMQVRVRRVTRTMPANVRDAQEGLEDALLAIAKHQKAKT